jgi:hypothetical protein
MCELRDVAHVRFGESDGHRQMLTSA